MTAGATTGGKQPIPPTPTAYRARRHTQPGRHRADRQLRFVGGTTIAQRLHPTIITFSAANLHKFYATMNGGHESLSATAASIPTVAFP
jgi:hypothetical protein